jgi:hypothetical protein
MKLSNRILWFLILFGFVLFFYWFYKYFFELKVTNLTISSNISNFSWSLVNTKFRKDFFCENEKCLIDNIPPFEYTIIIKKENYKTYNKKIDLWKTLNTSIYLEKYIKLKKVDNLIDSEIDKKRILKVFTKSVNYKKVYNSNNYIYYHDFSNLYFYNLNNSNLFFIKFNPKVHYIKNIWSNNFIIVSEFWSYNLNILNKNLEYFTLFLDYTKFWNNYIWIINSWDRRMKKNYWFENISGTLLVSYNINSKKKYILKNVEYEISKIYNYTGKIYIENNTGKLFEVKWY